MLDETRSKPTWELHWMNLKMLDEKFTCNHIFIQLQYRHFPVNYRQFFKKPYLQNTSGWLLLPIPPFKAKFYPLTTICLLFSSFFPLINDNCNYGNLLRKCLKVNILLLFTIVYSKININVVNTMHITENTDFFRQKPRQLPSAEVNFEGCFFKATATKIYPRCYPKILGRWNWEQ